MGAVRLPNIILVLTIDDVVSAQAQFAYVALLALRGGLVGPQGCQNTHSETQNEERGGGVR